MVVRNDSGGPVTTGTGAICVDNMLQFESHSFTWNRDTFEIRDRVPNNRNETGVVYSEYDGKTVWFTAHPWDTKFRGWGLVSFYDQNSGYNKAVKDAGDWLDNADNHLTDKGIALKNGYTYAISERNHGQIFDLWRAKAGDYNFYKIDTCSGQNARGEFWQVGHSSFVVAYQRTSNKVTIRTLDSLTETLSNFKDLIIPSQVGKRVYTFRPNGSYKDASGYYYQVIQSSTSAAHEEYFVWKTLDWSTFYSLDGSVSISIPNSAAAITVDVLRGYAGKFKIAGTLNTNINIANIACSLGDDGVFRYIWIDEKNNNVFYFGYFDGSGFTQTVTSLPGYTPLPSAQQYSFAQVNTNAGKLQVQINGADHTREFVIGKRVFYSPYGQSATVLSKAFSGGNTLVTLDTPYVSNTTGFVRPPVPPDYISMQWMQHKHGITYAAIVVLDETMQIWDGARAALYPAYRYHMFRTSNNGASWTDMGDMNKNIINHNIHKLNGPQNYIPDGVNFAFVSCLYGYGVTTIDKDIAGAAGDAGSGTVGQIYTNRASFGRIQTEPNTPFTPSGDHVTWSIKYDAGHVNTTGNVITQLNDQSGNSRDATAVGAPQLSNSAINTLGSGYFTIPSYATFYSDTKFTFACVLQKTNDGYLLSFGDEADAYKHVGIRVKAGGVGSKFIQYTSISTEAVEGRGQTLGSDFYIMIVTCNGYHIRMFINGIEMNKNYTAATLPAVARWSGYFNTDLDNMVIGAKKTSNLETAPVAFKYWAYKSDSAISDYSRKKLENYLASTYSITLRQLGTRGAYQPETELAFSRAGGTPTAAQKKDVDDLVVAIKIRQGLPLNELSLGNKFDRIYALGAKYQAVATKNLARPFFDLTSSGTVTYTADQGYKSDGTTGYFSTGFNPSLHASWASNNTAFGAYVITDPTRGNKSVGGLSAGTNQGERIFPRNTSDLASGGITATSGLTTASTSMPGFYAASRTGTTRYFLRETTEVTGVTAAQAYINAIAYLLAENDDGVASFLLDANVAFYYSGVGADLINRSGMRTDVRAWLLNKGVSIP